LVLSEQPHGATLCAWARIVPGFGSRRNR
jgi:hypothetical protein